MFRIEGAAGRTLTLDLLDAPLDKWSTLNPVFSSVEDIHAIESFETREAPSRARPLRAPNGPLLPDTSGQKWRFVRDVTVEEGTLRLTQRFESDLVWLAMKYPYTCGYNDRFLDSLARRRLPFVEVIEIARSKEGRPVRLVRIGTGGEDRKPCVLIYAREHPTEHDTSWVAEGVVRFLVSGAPETHAVLQRFTFLVIPMLDPDGAAASKYENVIATFADGMATPESLGVAAWFKRWVDEGKRLDLCFALHNVESAESPHVACPMMEPASARLEECRRVHSAVTEIMRREDYEVQAGSWQKSHCLFRLSGFSARYYGALPVPYEVNSQAPSRHLTLEELREMGACFVRAAARHLRSSEGRRLIADVTRLRLERARRWRRYGHLFEGRDAIFSEEWCRVMPRIERRDRAEGRDLGWLDRKREP
jgi:AraC-like DNA-binding protein